MRKILRPEIEICTFFVLVGQSRYTLPPEMFGAFGSVWCKMALGEVGVSSHDDATPSSFWLQATDDFL